MKIPIDFWCIEGNTKVLPLQGKSLILLFVSVLYIYYFHSSLCHSNNGTDHAWGGHYMVLGGDIEGGKIHGKYPSDLTPAGNLVDDRGRIIPTTSWDSIWNGVLEWTGITKQEDLDYCIPNRFRTINPVEAAGNNFPLMTADSLFRPQNKNIRRKK